MKNDRGDYIAEICDVSRSTVSRWNKNNSMPALYKILVDHILNGHIYIYGPFKDFEIYSSRIYDQSGNVRCGLIDLIACEVII